MSENVRVCQFYLRGRCKREKCEFKHPQELVNRPQVSLSKSGSVERSRSKDRKVRTYESDEDRPWVYIFLKNPYLSKARFMHCF